MISPALQMEISQPLKGHLRVKQTALEQLPLENQHNSLLNLQLVLPVWECMVVQQWDSQWAVHLSQLLAPLSVSLLPLIWHMESKLQCPAQ